MKLNIGVKNKSIDFLNQKLIINNNGIYVIKGENGVGKTSIIKDIIYNDTTIINNKADFCFVEQDALEYDISVLDYIKKYNKINEKKMNYYLNKLKLDNIDLKQNIKSLSGGERTKLSIISGLLKNSQFLFLDEPTNNLDDFSVEALIEILMEYKENHKLIIITHDLRIDKIKDYEIIIEENKIVQNENDVEKFSNSNNICLYPKKDIIKRSIKNPISIMFIINMFSLFVWILLLNGIAFSMFYNGEVLPHKNQISIYGTGNYSELNEVYVNSTKLKNINENHNISIKYDDLDSLLNLKNIDKIYLKNYIYINQIVKSYNSNTLLDNEFVISYPECLLDYDYYSTGFGILNMDFTKVLEGRIPQDNKREVVISKNLVIKNFGEEKNIGDIIKIDELEYNIVGIGAYDVFLTSYNKSSENIIFEYNESKKELIEEIVEKKGIMF